MIDRRSQFVGRRIKNLSQWKIGIEKLKIFFYKKRNIALTSKEDKSNWSPPSVSEKEREEMVED